MGLLELNDKFLGSSGHHKPDHSINDNRWIAAAFLSERLSSEKPLAGRVVL
jgi:hypothetical protein